MIVSGRIVLAQYWRPGTDSGRVLSSMLDCVDKPFNVERKPHVASNAVLPRSINGPRKVQADGVKLRTAVHRN